MLIHCIELMVAEVKGTIIFRNNQTREVILKIPTGLGGGIKYEKMQTSVVYKFKGGKKITLKR